MGMTNWATVVLCTDADVAAFEETWPSWAPVTALWLTRAKDQLAKRLRLHLREQELETDAAEVLDNIGNPSILRDSAAYMALHLCAQSNQLAPGDYWADKAAHYGKLMEAELERALAMLQFDVDESGAIDDAEKYQSSATVRFSRGA